MTLSLFDAQLFEKVCQEKYKDKNTFSKIDVLNILNEMTKSEKYYPKGKIRINTKYKVFKYFVRYCFYRNLANFDSMILLTGDKGCISLDEKIRTDKGIKSVNQLKLKDKDLITVESYNFKKNKKELALAQYFYTGKKRTYCLELADGRKVNATSKHKFFIRRNNKVLEVELKDILLTDEIAISE